VALIGVSAAHRERQQDVCAFVERVVMPEAERIDREERMPEAIVASAVEKASLGSTDAIGLGLLHEALARGCASLCGIVTVQTMVSSAIARCGTRAQREAWLPRLTSGGAQAAFALTEPEAGSDIAAIGARAVRRGGEYVISGSKRWITAGRSADVFLVVAKVGDAPTAFLLERTRPGLSVRPVAGMLGMRGAMLADLDVVDCVAGDTDVLGPVGGGLSVVGNFALDVGRYCIAWGSVGLGQACLDATLLYATSRKLFGSRLGDHPLTRRKLANMVARIEAARLLCVNAGWLRDQHDPDSVAETCIAKYVAAETCVRAASSALQMHGARGCSRETPVERYFRDAQIMQVIEGSSDVQQLLIAERALAARQSHPLAQDRVSPVFV